MKLPAEWEAIELAIRAQYWNTKTLTINEAITLAVERCYKLHTKPPKELTDSEIEALTPDYWSDPIAEITFARAVIAAHIRKQSEPERVKFRAARFKDTCNVIVERADWKLPEGREWLEPEQSFEVVLP